jgi:FeS assembly SUF system regulator
MLRISKLTDYGVVLTTTMASHPEDATHTVRDLAAETGIPQPTVAKVLKTLTRDGILESQRGAHGGYKLSRRAAEISIAEIVRALEGPIGVTECSHDEGACGYEGRCDVQANWKRISAVVEHALAGISLSDMVSPPPVLVSLSTSGKDPRKASH